MEQHRKKDPKSTFTAVQKAVTYLLLTHGGKIWAESKEGVNSFFVEL